MIRFLVIFDRRRGSVIEVRQLNDESGSAGSARLTAEEIYRDRPEVEVVVLTGDSERSLRNTHARYFESVHDLAEGALTRMGG